MINPKIDLTGQKFNSLTVLEQAEDYIEPNGRHRAQWLCKCDCGNECIVLGDNLKKNNTKSCGCLKHKNNTYDLTGEYGIGYDKRGNQFIFDLEDYEKISKDNLYWGVNNDGYVMADIYIDGKRSHIGMHRYLTDCPKGLVVDHINQNRGDNRKNNLRCCTHSQNHMNCGTQANNTSGVRGVRWYKNKQKWYVDIKANKKHIFLGYYDDFNEAIKVRKEAEEKYFGEYKYEC